MLRTTAVAGSAAIVSWLGSQAALAEADPLAPQPAALRAFAYFTAPEIVFIDAAVSRLIPADELGPGAKEAGVTFFIDQQIAGSFGRAETWYMQGPWKKGTPEQGYQLKLTLAQLYRAGIQAIDDYCRRTFNNKTFAELGASDQDKILWNLRGANIALEGISGSVIMGSEVKFIDHRSPRVRRCKLAYPYEVTDSHSILCCLP